MPRSTSSTDSAVGLPCSTGLRIGPLACASTVDGFFGNAAPRIALPEQYAGVADAVRRIGMASQVDAFGLSMNRAARTTALLRKVFG